MPTSEEIEIIFRWAAVDLSKVREKSGRWRTPLRGEYRPHSESRVFVDLMRGYHATGARTSELCLAQVRDFMPRTKQLCLGRHKRATTTNSPTVRNIQLGDEIVDILTRNARNKETNAPLFSARSGGPWKQDEVNRRLRKVKAVAADHGEHVRAHITPYSFRDLYISASSEESMGKSWLR